jgi:hypothetical protein
MIRKAKSWAAGLGLAFSFLGGFVIYPQCSCPGWYFCAAAMAVPSIIWGKWWIRLLGATFCVFGIAGGIYDIGSDQRHAARLQKAIEQKEAVQAKHNATQTSSK